MASAPADADERDAASADVSAYSADEIDRDTAAQNALRRWTGTA